MKRENSNSDVQLEAERIIGNLLSEHLNIDLEFNKKIFLGQTHVIVDAYSKSASLVGEIFAHIGKLKVAQQSKVQNDILKMIYIDSKTGVQHRKLIVVCDNDLFDQLHNGSWKSDVIKEFGIEVIKIQIPPEIRDKIIKAQCKQNLMV